MDNKKDQIFEAIFIDVKLFEDISKEFSISRDDLTKLSDEYNKTKSEIIVEIKRIRQLYHNKKNMEGFSFDSFNDFYNWHVEQYNEQQGKCKYCQTDESVIAQLFNTVYKDSLRSLNRGQHLEIDRKDPRNQEYSKNNCALVCYFCNNDKSDIFNEADYLEYLKNRKEFLENKLSSLNKEQK